MSRPLTLHIDPEDRDDDPTCLSCGMWFSEIAWHRWVPDPLVGANHVRYGCPTDDCRGQIYVHDGPEPAHGPPESPRHPQ